MVYNQWKLRLKLAQGAAAAVAYMHAQHPVLLHSDLKSPNFLVTEEFVSKVSMCVNISLVALLFLESSIQHDVSS